MTERNPFGMSFEDVVEQKIKAAQEKGAFTDLPGAGRPLDLSDDDPMWWLKRKLENEGLALPPTPKSELRNWVADRVGALSRLKTTAEVRKLAEEINTKIGHYNATSMDGSGLGLVDPDALLARWSSR